MQALLDFFAFRTFVSQELLILGYALGAIGVPVASWALALWIKGRYRLVSASYERGKAVVRGLTRARDRALFWGMFLTAFVMMELMWRMMFEFLIAYLQMRDALVHLAA